ncbi:MAG: TetR/AcrR family transcriptional regulator [Intestinimonas sp.]|jgi:probable dihydroxyacetone kinase regulator|nr:TetR/AcrR family transcriptional regulator [Intestinimonas sp.]
MPDSNITKQALARTMKKLMAQQPFSKISVGDICETCGMSRKSFYYHFKDKHDLVNWVFYTEFIQTIQKKDYLSSWGLITDICRYFYSERDFYRNALEIQGQNSFRSYFSETMEPFLFLLTQDLFQDIDDPQFYITFFSDALLAAIIRWLTGPECLPPEKFLSQLKATMVDFARLTLTFEEDDS